LGLRGPPGDNVSGLGGAAQVLRYDGNTGAFIGVVASGVLSRYLTFRPGCAVTSAGTYVNGDALNVGLHIVNDFTRLEDLPVEVRLWLDVPNSRPRPVKVPRLPKNLAVGYDNTWSVDLGTVDPSFPRGPYRVGCRLLNPVTGGYFSERFSSFTVQ